MVEAETATASEARDFIREAVRAYLEESSLPPWGEDAPTVEIDALQLHQLRALGYEL